MMSAVGFHEIHSQNYFSQPPLKRTRIDGPYSFNHQNIPQSSVASRTSYLPSPGTGTPPPFCPVTATPWTNQIPFTPSNQNITCVPSFYSPTVIFPGQQSQESSPIGTEFDPEKLKTRHESVIRSLYADLPRQCSTCGMRFKTIEENTKHIHWHVRKNLEAKKNKEKKNKRMVSRKYFWGLKEWLCAAEAIGNVKGPAFKVVEEEMNNNKKCEKVFCDVIADEFHKVCPLCLERFDECFSNDANDWMFREAVRFNPEKIPERRLIRSLIGSVVHSDHRL